MITILKSSLQQMLRGLSKNNWKMAERRQTPLMRYKNNISVCNKHLKNTSESNYLWNTYSCGYGNRITPFDREHAGSAIGLLSRSEYRTGSLSRAYQEEKVRGLYPQNMSHTRNMQRTDWENKCLMFGVDCSATKAELIQMRAKMFKK